SIHTVQRRFAAYAPLRSRFGSGPRSPRDPGPCYTDWPRRNYATEIRKARARARAFFRSSISRGETAKQSRSFRDRPEASPKPRYLFAMQQQDAERARDHHHRQREQLAVIADRGQGDSQSREV